MFVEIKIIFKAVLGIFLTQEQLIKLSSSFYKIRQILNSDERAYFTNKHIFQYFVKPKEVRANVGILGLRTFSTHNLSVFEKVLSDFLRNNGADTSILMCDNVLDSCDIEEQGGISQKVFCIQCKKEKKQFKSLYKNEYFSFKKYISIDEKEEMKKYIYALKNEELLNLVFMGVNVGKHSVASTVKYFRKGNIEPDNIEHQKVLRHSALQALISVKVASKYVEIEKPTHLISLHGCYVSWGPFCDYCMNHGVYVVLYVKAVHKVGYFLFPLHGTGTADFSAGENKALWDNFKNSKLTEKRKKELRDFMNQKRAGRTMDYKLFSEGKNSDLIISAIQQILEANNCKKYALFPNLLWDAGLENRGLNIFEDVYDWMFSTIEYFIKHREYYLLIKPHPGEASICRTEKGANEIIIERFGKLPKNIILVPKEYPLTSYDLMDKNFIGITYDGSAGMEYSYFKKPILVGGSSHYVTPGVVLKAKSLKEYFGFIKNPDVLFEYPEKNYELIERYTYFFFFRLIVKIPFIRNDVWLGHCVDWDVLKEYSKFITDNKTMNHIAKSIIEKRSVVESDY